MTHTNRITTKQPVKKALTLAIATLLAAGSPAYGATYIVDSATDDGDGAALAANPGAGNQSLSWAIRQANVNAGADIIQLTTDVIVTGVMKSLIDSEITLQSDGIIRSISGGDTYRPLFIKSGTVVIQDLNLTNGRAQGGSSDDGGGGAGLGGALFVYSGDVTLKNVSLANNYARGGNGGANRFSYGGGGMGGGSKSYGGGGLFAESTNSTGAYGGNGYYGGSTNGGFGGGGQGGSSVGVGGFGGGGGASSNRAGKDGGFGGGGGGTDQGGSGGDGGFGGGGANYASLGGYGGGNGGNLFRGVPGGGAGFGGALFAKKGTVTLIDVSFATNTVVGGTGNQSGTAAGADIFICTSVQGDTECSAVVNACGTTTTTNVAGGTLSANCPAVAGNSVTPIPTLSSWALLILAGLMSVFGFRARNKKQNRV